VIGFMKLLSGRATVSPALCQARGEETREAAMLQFTPGVPPA